LPQEFVYYLLHFAPKVNYPMSDTELLEPWKQLNLLVELRDVQGLHDFVEAQPASDVARALSRIDEDARRIFMELLRPEIAADVLESISDAQAADMVEDLSAETAAEILDELYSDHLTDILAEMNEEDATAILAEMDDSDADEIRKLLTYNEDTAGGIMSTEYIVYPDAMTVREVLEDLRNKREEYAGYGISYTYVESEKGTLTGVVPLRELILAPAGTPIKKVMIANPVYVLDSAPLDEVAQIFDQYPFFVLPVTDGHGKVLGVIHRGDAEEAELDRHERAFLRFSGIVTGEELRSMPITERAMSRLLWLGLNLVLSVLAASVVLAHQATIAQLFVLVFFMPVICNLSGCSGNQAVAVSIRELTLGLIKPADYFYVWRKEVLIGLFNGSILGFALGLVALLLWHESAVLGVIIGFAFMVNTIVAVSLGGLIPLALRRLNVDPALGAPPILTTLTDMCGFLFVLTLAHFALKMGII